MLNMYLAVAAGGAVGSLGRYLFVGGSARWLGVGFPWGTLGVNVLGSLLMGAAAGWFAIRASLPPELQAFVTVGMLGGFTTFSAFSWDMVHLYERGQVVLAFVYGAASFGLSLGALILGLAFTRKIIAG